MAQPTAKAYTLPSAEPTYTELPAAAGDESIAPPVLAVHNGAQVPAPVEQLVGKAYSLPSAEPT